MKKLLLLALALSLSSCAILGDHFTEKQIEETNTEVAKTVSVKSQKVIAIEQARVESSSQLKSNAISPYYEMVYQIRQTCHLSNKEPQVSVTKDIMDNGLFTKLQTETVSDKENLKLLFSTLKELNCSLTKNEFLELAKHFKCFMTMTQTACNEYNANKSLIITNPSNPEDVFISNELSKPSSLCNKNWDIKVIRNTKWCTVPADGVDIN